MKRREQKPLNQLIKPTTSKPTTRSQSNTQLYNLHGWGNLSPTLPQPAATQIPFPKGSPHTNRRPSLTFQPPVTGEQTKRSSSVPTDIRIKQDSQLGNEQKELIDIQVQANPEKQEDYLNVDLGSDQQITHSEDHADNQQPLDNESDNQSEVDSNHSESDTTCDSSEESTEEQVTESNTGELYDTMSHVENFGTPAPFTGSVTEGAEAWWNHLEDYFIFRGWIGLTAPTGGNGALAAHTTLVAEGQRKIKSFLPLLLKDLSYAWFKNLSPDQLQDFDSIKQAFKERYIAVPKTQCLLANVWNHRQVPNESVDNYYVSLMNLAKQANMNEETYLKEALVNGLLPQIKREILLNNPGTIQGVVDLARRFEQANLLLKKTETQMSQLSVHEMTPNVVDKPRRSYSPSPVRNSQRVHFSEGQKHPHEPRDTQRRDDSDNSQFFQRTSSRSTERTDGYGQQRSYTPPQQGRTGFEQRSNSQSRNDGRHPSNSRQPGNTWNNNRYPTANQQPRWNQGRGRSPYRTTNTAQQPRSRWTNGQSCNNCGRIHDRGQCPAFNKTCSFCGIRNHFQQVCRKRLLPVS